MEFFYRRFPNIVFSYTKMRPMFYPEALVEGFARVARERQANDTGLVLCGIAGHMEPGIWPAVQEKIKRLGIADRVFVIEDLDHDAFLHALGRATVYLRSHVSDGVCSSVMEALALGVPVVASENYTRPPSVITYPPEDVGALARALMNVLSRREEIVSRLQRPAVRDTLHEEAQLLTG
jgi:glycosyltransferase involved in cell wall biosynthesis